MKHFSCNSFPGRALSLQLLGICMVAGKAQQPKHPLRTIYGSTDADIQIPLPEGIPGQKDPSALSAVTDYINQSLSPKDKEIDVVGVLTLGSGNGQERLPVSFAIASGNKFRLDVMGGHGLRSFRINGSEGHIQEPDQKAVGLGDSEGLDPLAFPMALLDLVHRKDSSLVDDGIATIDEQKLHKLTITLFSTRLGKPIGVALYFNTGDHTLRKSAVIEHSRGDDSLKYLKVTTYGDYREEDSILLPHEYSESINGQPAMSLKVTTISVIANHDDSYFSF